ncbi:MAG: hypothetical protein M1825_002240 [Sarcosagium campestre]|nr:MAG: hypothetical protein M1825_002240 [Sarcosagium campestre]
MLSSMKTLMAVALGAALIAPAVAVPVSDVNEAPAAVLEARAPGVNSCKEGHNHYFQVHMAGFGHRDGSCGQGLLDNLRGACGVVVSGWGCDPDPKGSDTDAHFSLLGVYKPGCVEDAIHYASGNTVNIRCTQ